MTECTTHHFACDCREEKFKQLELENAALRATLTLIRSTTDESGLSQAQVIETIGKYCDEVLGEETRT
jgi:hypothetical protein